MECRTLDLDSLLEDVKGIVLKAAPLMDMDTAQVFEKDGVANLVTSADLAVQHCLAKELVALVPGCGFFGEEEHLCTKGDGRRWIVDPIDGTANFTRRLGQSGISVAFVDGDDILLGVVYNPVSKEMFWAVKGKGSFLNGKPLHVSNLDFQHSIYCTAFSLYRKEFAQVCNDILMDAYFQCADFRRFGACSLEMCYLAAGKVDMFFEIRLSPWDYCAATLIVREAGGFVEGFDGASPSLEKPCPLVVANSRENLERLKGIIARHLKEVPYKD